jgi:SAM-dependent methyltransferase
MRYLGRPVAHISPRYVLDRCLVKIYEQRNPDAPWITARAAWILNELLRKSDNGLEYGSGRSTVWLAKRTNSLVSVEGSPDWYARVNDRLSSEGLTNVSYKYVQTDCRLANCPGRPIYVMADPNLRPGCLDYALVDGYYRDECIMRALDLLKPGGILILDNANWFIPRKTRSPGSASVPPEGLWSEFLSRAAGWRLIWTTNGVSDTAIWFTAN